ncbi:MAG: DNAase [Gammaproteobacteria bacterium]|nr:MAG: DNAase [Gammaproteobacteria bacterium]
MLIDSHCHLNLLADNEETLADLIQNATEQDVRHILGISIDLASCKEIVAIAERYPQITASVGIHPNVDKSEIVSVEELVKLATHEKVIAIGETGLDYFRSEGDLEWQRDRFRTHIHAAKKVAKPLIIHTREAREDTMRILEEEGAEKAGGIIHCFTEDWETAQRALDLGFYISLSGIVTFKNAVALQDVAKRLPADRILIETDAPYLAPVPHRGKTNQPAYVRHVAEFVAELRQQTVAEIAEQTTANFSHLFPEAILY